MRTLLILVCEHDASLAIRLLRRLELFGAWNRFSLLHLHLDKDVCCKTEEEIRHAAPANIITVKIVRASPSECWVTRRAETMLSIYQMACVDDQDIVRIDPDVFVASPMFIEAVCRLNKGIAGKLMRLHLPARIRGRQLDFIQGGVSCWGEEGRRFLKALKSCDIDRFRETYTEEIDCMVAEHSSQYAYYFNRTEDVILTGGLSIMAGVERTHIESLQVSPYDVIRNHRSEELTYKDFVTAYERSGALAYHFEGGHSGRRGHMTEMLTRYYEQNSGHRRQISARGKCNVRDK